MPKRKMTKTLEKIEEFLKSIYLKQANMLDETPFIQALNYTLLAGGKRIRPLLFMLFSEICAHKMKVDFVEKNAIPCACALEMIHTYSLIHDDLPAMDNDDLRRGKPTCHKKFDEATAILTGDALLTDAFNIFTQGNFKAENLLKAISFLSICAGSKGMVAGQVLDMAMENTNFIKNFRTKNSLAEEKYLLIQMNGRKTGDLLLASCTLPSILYGTDTDFQNECSSFARYFGLAFQITDDILDITGNTELMGKPKGSDIEASKSTWVTLLGLEEAKKEANKHINLAQEQIKLFTQEQNFIDENSYPIKALSILVNSLIDRAK